MTIASHVREINNRFSNLERCAEMAPEGTYERTKEAVDAVHSATDGILSALKDMGFKALNDDRLRNLEAAIYGYLLESNPEEYELYAAEGFGEYVDDPVVGKRILAQSKANRDFLAGLNA